MIVTKTTVLHPACSGQVKELGSGNFGVAKLMKDRSTGELVAVKFIERGEKVGPFSLVPSSTE